MSEKMPERKSIEIKCNSCGEPWPGPLPGCPRCDNAPALPAVLHVIRNRLSSAIEAKVKPIDGSIPYVPEAALTLARAEAMEEIEMARREMREAKDVLNVAVMHLSALFGDAWESCSVKAQLEKVRTRWQETYLKNKAAALSAPGEEGKP